jgi:hypothetical protein
MMRDAKMVDATTEYILTWLRTTHRPLPIPPANDIGFWKEVGPDVRDMQLVAVAVLRDLDLVEITTDKDGTIYVHLLGASPAGNPV